MLQHFHKLEQAVKARRKTDYHLVNWWLYFLLLSWITLGIYPLYVFYKRIDRRDQHFARIREVFEVALLCTKEVADRKGINVDYELEALQEELSDLDEKLFFKRNAALFTTIAVIGVFLSMFIDSAVIISILVGLYVASCLTIDWQELQQAESKLVDEFNYVWLKTGVINYPISVEITIPRRSAALYIVLTCLTLGLWGIYWDYVLHTEPQKVFAESEQWETTIFNSFRNLDMDENLRNLLHQL